jgi:SNF family Na+-dependent transporter
MYLKCCEYLKGAFVIAFVIMLLFIGMPLFFLELTISQYSKLGPLDVWKISPAFQGLGYAAVFGVCLICLYYNVIISYCLIYLISSFIPNLPWTSCSNWWNNGNCSTIITKNLTNESFSESPSKQFF